MKQFRRVYYTTNVPKLRSFQYRLLHRALVLNSHLFHWGKRSDFLCTFCNTEKETLVHLFVSCSIVHSLWIVVKNFVHQMWNITLDLSAEAIMWGNPNNKNNQLSSFISLVTKQYIYRNRCLGTVLRSEELFSQIINIRNIEKFCAVKANTLDKYYEKWEE